jgi:4-amino-4-deoxy-L-arabinose transferase-like glycosyltransferase
LPNRSHRWLIAVLATGLVLRLAFVLSVRDRPLVGDEGSYDQIAWNLASGRGYSMGNRPEPAIPTASRGPGYILPLAASYRVAGHSKLAILIAQVFLDVTCIVLVWRIGRRLFGPALALGGAVLYAVYPPMILQSGGVLTETMVNASVLAALDAGLRWGLDGWRPGLPLSGLAMGICALNKPQLAPVAVLIVLAMRPALGSARFWGPALLQVALVAAVLAPWMVRNEMVFHRLIPGVTNGGVTFWGGTGPDHGRTIGGIGEPGVPASVRAAIRGMSESERDRYLYAEGIRVIRAAPGRFALLMFRKVARLWFNLGFDDPPSRGSLMLAAANAILIALGIVAVVTLKPPAPAVSLLVAMAVFFSIVHMIFFSTVRYSLPCYAYLFSFSGAELWRRLPRFGAHGAPISGGSSLDVMDAHS